MAGDTGEKLDRGGLPDANALTLGLAFIAGTGVILMIAGAILGVVNGSEADSAEIGLIVLAGAALTVCGLGGWLGVYRPWDNFDDIEVPADTGHHHHADDHANETDTHSLPETSSAHH